MSTIEQGGADIFGGAKESKQTLILAELQKLSGLSIAAYDYISVSYNDGTFTETYVYKTGGSGGTTVATITVIYVDITKAKLVSITKT